jgi:hypothetical protein
MHKHLHNGAFKILIIQLVFKTECTGILQNSRSLIPVFLKHKRSVFNNIRYTVIQCIALYFIDHQYNGE